jgi:DNA sulfur modification protein DndC
MATAPKNPGSRPSAFSERGLAKTIQDLSAEIRGLYLGDAVPWVVGYSGGKDSSAILQLVWLAIRDLPSAQRKKPIHVITTDTLVEQPLVAAWVDTSQARMREAAAAQGLPITPSG